MVAIIQKKINVYKIFRYQSCIKAGKKSLSCHGRLTIYGNGQEKLTGTHNHDIDNVGEDKDKFYAALKEASKVEATPLKCIYDRYEFTNE